jgi:WD40 repeat protein
MRCFRFAMIALLSMASLAAAQLQKDPPPATPTLADDGKLPDGARLRLGSSKFRDANYISTASLSPDGKIIAICAGQQTIRFLDIATGKEVRRFGVREYLRTQQILWSADGKQITTTGYNGINSWDAQNGKLIKQVANANKDGRDGTIHLSADGKFVAIGSQYENAVIKVVDLSSGNQLCTVKPAQNSTVQGAMAPKGELLATWGQHYNRGNNKPEDDLRIARTVQLWDPKTGTEKLAIVSEINQIQCVRFSPDGTKVVAGGYGIIQLWDVATGKLERQFAGRSGQGTQIVFSPDGKTLAVGGTDSCVQSWDITTGKRAGMCDGPAATVTGLQYRPDGKLLAWATNINAVEIWEVPCGKLLTPVGGHTSPINALLFAADGKTLISCGNEGKMLRWDLATGKEVGPFEMKISDARRRNNGYPAQAGQNHFSPNGKYLIAGGSNGTASVWDVDAGLEMFALTSAGGYVDRAGIIAFSGDSSKLIAMNRYGGRDAALPIPVWDMETGVPQPPLKGQKGDFTAAGFSTDGRILVTAAYNYQPQGGQIAEAWAWDTATGKSLSKVHLANVQINAIQFIDHRLYVLFSPNYQQGGIKVYDAVTGREVRTLELPKNENQQGGQGAALSPDRRLLAYSPIGYDYGGPDGLVRSSPRRVIVWEVSSGSIRHEFNGIAGNTTALAFSRDGKTLASGTSDTTIYLWDLNPKADTAEALTAANLDDLWKTLESPSAKKAEEALRTLIARPSEAVPFLKSQLKPIPAVKPDPEKIAKLIADLDAPRFQVREAAMRDLERLGNLAREAVAESLKKTTITPEVRERLEKLSDSVNKPDTGADWVRPLRTVEALERMGSVDAIAHLKDVAAGGDSPTTRAAKEALGRSSKK